MGEVVKSLLQNLPLKVTQVGDRQSNADRSRKMKKNGDRVAEDASGIWSPFLRGKNSGLRKGIKKTSTTQKIKNGRGFQWESIDL